MKRLVRWFAATILVVFPASYLLWEWRFKSDPILPQLSYTGFRERFSVGDSDYWTHAVWVLLVLIVLNSGIRLVELGIVAIENWRDRDR
ncbi:MAG: hypothetical protein RL885_00215 [Planctomycetota bacterium]